MGKERLLDGIKSPYDLKKLSYEQLDDLAKEIREELIETVSETGGHLASNLGVVELTIAIHKVFDSPKDKIIWDVGHQAYTHKLLTGRADMFSTLRTEDGISGFTRPYESEHDIFYSGHSSTSISSSLGIAVANVLKENHDKVIAVIGDGSSTGGLFFEGLNNAGRIKDSNLLVILNDNNMSISGNVGSLAKYLSKIRSKPRYFFLKERTYNIVTSIPLVGKKLAVLMRDIKNKFKEIIYKTTVFEQLGFTYMGPFDGHDIRQLSAALNSTRKKNKPILFHVITKKGKGYDFAEKSPGQYHGISKFNIETGEPIPGGKTFSSAFGEYICEVGRNDKRICAVTAAMAMGTKLEDFHKEFPDRFFDVGIAEEHAVTFASGLAKNGMLPVFAVYSTFLQRCYDQLVHDCAMQKLRMIFAVDRAGFVGTDGESHQGLFDVAFLNTIPDIAVFSPSTFPVLMYNFYSALFHTCCSSAIRYPRGVEHELPEDYTASGEAYDVYGSSDAENIIVTYGRLFHHACKALKNLEYDGINVKIIKLNRIKPIDDEAINEALKGKNIFFFEEGIKSGGVGEKFGVSLLEKSFCGYYHITAVNDEFVPQASVSRLLEKYKMDFNGMVEEVKNRVGR